MKLTRSVLVAASCAALLTGSLAHADPLPPTGVAAGYVAPKITHRPYGELRIVVPLSSGEKMVQMIKLRNIANSLKTVGKWGGSLDVKVVVYARGVSLLASPDEGVRKQLDDLRAHHVTFEVCDNSLREQNIDFHNLYGVTEADIVPAGFAEVAYLQAQKHYVVDPMN